MVGYRQPLEIQAQDPESRRYDASNALCELRNSQSYSTTPNISFDTAFDQHQHDALGQQRRSDNVNCLPSINDTWNSSARSLGYQYTAYVLPHGRETFFSPPNPHHIYSAYIPSQPVQLPDAELSSTTDSVSSTDSGSSSGSGSSATSASSTGSVIKTENQESSTSSFNLRGSPELAMAISRPLKSEVAKHEIRDWPKHVISNLPEYTSTPLLSTLSPEEAVDKLSYAQLIWRALRGAENHTMSLQDIYAWIENHTEKAKDPNCKGWQNSIRHNLSMNEAFKKVPVDGTKGGFVWKLERSHLDKGPEPTTRYRNRKDDKGRVNKQNVKSSLRKTQKSKAYELESAKASEMAMYSSESTTNPQHQMEFPNTTSSHSTAAPGMAYGGSCISQQTEHSWPACTSFRPTSARHTPIPGCLGRCCDPSTYNGYPQTVPMMRSTRFDESPRFPLPTAPSLASNFDGAFARP